MSYVHMSGTAIKKIGFFGGWDSSFSLQRCFLEKLRGVLFVSDNMAWNQWLKYEHQICHQSSTDHFKHNGKWWCHINVFKLCWNWKLKQTTKHTTTQLKTKTTALEAERNKTRLKVRLPFCSYQLFPNSSQNNQENKKILSANGLFATTAFFSPSPFTSDHV